jgi:hypothetical protein
MCLGCHWTFEIQAKSNNKIRLNNPSPTNVGASPCKFEFLLSAALLSRVNSAQRGAVEGRKGVGFAERGSTGSRKAHLEHCGNCHASFRSEFVAADIEAGEHAVVLTGRNIVSGKNRSPPKGYCGGGNHQLGNEQKVSRKAETTRGQAKAS